MSDKKTALVVAAHPDDAEIAMGGTIAAMRASRLDVILVDLTDGEPTPHGSHERRMQEASVAAAALGIEKRINLGIKNREVFDNVENRKKLASVIREHKPEIMFVPYAEDAHPDHWEAHNLCIAARFYSKFVVSDMPFEPHYPKKFFHYFSLHLRVNILPSFIFDISKFVDKKFEALNAYKSQFQENAKNLKFLDRVKSENAFFGTQIGVDYGEAFYCKENLKVSEAGSLFTL